MRLFIPKSLYTLSGMAAHFEAIDRWAFSSFYRVGNNKHVPDGNMIGRFRRLLDEHRLQERLFAQLVELLTEHGLTLKKGQAYTQPLSRHRHQRRFGRGNAIPRLIPRIRAALGTLATRSTLAWTGIRERIMWRRPPRTSTM